jgi:hypothetical protein
MLLTHLFETAKKSTVDPRDFILEQANPEDYDDYEDEDEDLRLRSGDYVRDQQDGEYGEVFRMQGDPSERRVQILDRDGRGWYIEPSRLTRVDPQDSDVQRYFGKNRQRDMDEGINEGLLYSGDTWEDVLYRINVLNDIFGDQKDLAASFEPASQPEWGPFRDQILRSRTVLDTYAKVKQLANMNVPLTDVEIEMLADVAWDGGGGPVEPAGHWGERDYDWLEDLYAQQFAVVQHLLDQRAQGRGQNRTKSGQTVHEQGVAEEQKPGFGEFPPKQEITIVPPKKLKSDETYQDRNKYWQSQGQAPIYKTNEDNDQVKRVFKDKAGRPVGEIGIDPESSPGNGEWYVHHYATGYSVVGFDSAAEAKRELLYVHKHPDAVEGHPSTKEQGVAESAKPGEYYIHTVYFKDGTKKRVRVTSDEFDVADYYTKRGQAVDRVDYDFQLHSDMSEAQATKTRLDPKCWTGKKIGNPKTKVKGGVRVNNCVPAESVEQGVIEAPIANTDDPMDPVIHGHEKANPMTLQGRIGQARNQLRDLARMADSNDLATWEQITKLARGGMFMGLEQNLEQIRHGIEELAKKRKKGGVASRGISKDIG